MSRKSETAGVDLSFKSRRSLENTVTNSWHSRFSEYKRQPSVMMAMLEGILAGITILLKQLSRDSIRCESIAQDHLQATFF
jgi:hypothetical protein